MAVKKNDAEDKRTLLVKDHSGWFRITVPLEARITFGPMMAKGFGGELTLRIYEKETRQLAAFVGVETFRDLGLPLERLVVSESGEHTWNIDENGETETRKVKRARRFVDEGV